MLKKETNRKMPKKVLLTKGGDITKNREPNTDKEKNTEAIKALGYSSDKGIRHRSSLPPLVDRLRRAQQDMRDYIKGTNLKNCDGG